jgi:hypothetical protein
LLPESVTGTAIIVVRQEAQEVGRSTIDAAGQWPTAVYERGWDAAADYLEMIDRDGSVSHPAQIISALAFSGRVPAAVGKRIDLAWQATGKISDSRLYATATPEQIAATSSKAVSGGWCGGRKQRSSGGNGVGWDVGYFSDTRGVVAAAKADAYTPEVVAAVHEALTGRQTEALAACVSVLAARANFIAAFLPPCLHQMTVAQRKRAEVLAPAFAEWAGKLDQFAADLRGG